MKDIIVTTTSQPLADSVLDTTLKDVELSLLLRKSWDPASTERVFYISVSFLSQVGVNLFCSWLWDAIKDHRASGTKINGQGCPNSEAEIAEMMKRIVEESQQAEDSVENGER